MLAAGLSGADKLAASGLCGCRGGFFETFTDVATQVGVRGRQRRGRGPPPPPRAPPRPAPAPTPRPHPRALSPPPLQLLSSALSTPLSHPHPFFRSFFI